MILTSDSGLSLASAATESFSTSAWLCAGHCSLHGDMGNAHGCKLAQFAGISGPDCSGCSRTCTCGYGAKPLHHLHAAADAPKDGVLCIQPWRGCERDEELRKQLLSLDGQGC